MESVRFSHERLIEAREAAGLSRQKLADEAGNVSARMIFEIERGRTVPGSEKLAAIARVLGVDMETFFIESEAVA